MWQRLNQRYGRTSKIVDAILADVKQISINDTSDGNVLHMIKIVEKAHRDLKRLGEHAELRNSVSIAPIEQAMIPQMKHEVVKSLGHFLRFSVTGEIELNMSVRASATNLRSS